MLSLDRLTQQEFSERAMNVGVPDLKQFILVGAVRNRELVTERTSHRPCEAQCLNQLAVHGEVLIGHEILRLPVHFGEEPLRHIES